MKKIFILLLSFGLVACSTRQELPLSSPYLSGNLSLVPKMELKSTQDQILYQEEVTQSGQVLDSFIIDQERLETSLVAYVQQSFNQLRLAWYQISDEVTQKKSLKSWSSSQTLPAILKTFRIVNIFGVKLYAAQYYVDFTDRVQILSYTTDKLANRKAFIESVSQLSFTP